MPIWVPAGCPSMKASAASCATANRFGSTSVAHMLRETSSARMMEVRFKGTSIAATGRAMAVVRLATPDRKSAKGRCRRQRECFGSASRMIERLE
jgi:hypothetical protein